MTTSEEMLYVGRDPLRALSSGRRLTCLLSSCAEAGSHMRSLEAVEEEERGQGLALPWLRASRSAGCHGVPKDTCEGAFHA